VGTSYRLYANSGGGLFDPVDYTTPIATGTSSPLLTPPLTAPGDYLFGVRAKDSASGLEDANVSVVRFRIDASGVNVTALPNAPSDLQVIPFGSGSLLIRWSYNTHGQGGAPVSFKVWANTGALSYAAAVKATVTYSAFESTYEVTLTGLTAGIYNVGIRATNATGDETNVTAIGSGVVSTTGPAVVENLVATTTAIAK